MRTDLISFIIPTLNEASYIITTLESLRLAGFEGEIILADGGSKDATIALASKYKNVRILNVPKSNRAIQMNYGAGVATSDYLFFLHADSIFPKQGLHILKPRLERHEIEAGSFSLSFNQNKPIYRLLSQLSQINHVLSTYGDQGLLIRRDVYEAIGGFKALSFLEDIDIGIRIRRAYNFEKFPFAITTAARRFERNGPLRQTLVNILIVMGYCIGLSPKFLKRFYS